MMLLAQVVPARAADGSLVVSALQVLERDYAEPVHAVDLLNAALATVRTPTHQNAAILPDTRSAAGCGHIGVAGILISEIPANILVTSADAVMSSRGRRDVAVAIQLAR